jgi:SAM-dependent methyltransferase
MTIKMKSSPDYSTYYDLIASEYYSPGHYTTRNFDEATAWYLQLTRGRFEPYLGGTVVDIGCGRGQLHHYFPRIRPLVHIEVDTSLAMLKLTRKGVTGLLRADARNLPLKNEMADICTAFLFDPFNVTPFENEARRITKSGGLFLGTLPSIRWGAEARRLAGLPLDSATFRLKNQRKLQVPSHLSTHDELRDRFRRAGFKDVSLLDIATSPVGRLPSPHVVRVAQSLSVSPESLGIVTVLICNTK